MTFLPAPKFVAILSFLTLRTLLVEAADPVSISEYDGYLDQVNCVKLCLWESGTLDDLIAKLDCSPPWVNGCFCNPELAGTANDFISTCVAKKCSAQKTAPAVTSALSAYNGYCSEEGYSIPTIASIQSFSAFDSQPKCVQKCLWDPQTKGRADLMPAIDCQAPWEDACLCDKAMVGTASSFLSSCVATKCDTDEDASPITAALSVHRAYCSAAGLPLPATKNTVTSTSDTTTDAASTATPGAKSDTASGATSDATSGTLSATASSATDTAEDAQQSPGLSSGTIAGITVGIVGGIAALILAVVFVMYKRRTTGKPPESPQAQGPWAELQDGRQQPPPWIHEKPLTTTAVEADTYHPATRFELQSGTNTHATQFRVQDGTKPPAAWFELQSTNTPAPCFELPSEPVTPTRFELDSEPNTPVARPETQGNKHIYK